MNIGQNLEYVARGCFLAGTLIATPDGEKPIEELKAGDSVISFNEKTKTEEVSIIGSIDVLNRESYYTINGIVKATAEHPFYTNEGIVEVKNLGGGHELVTRYGNTPLGRIEITHDVDVEVFNLLNVTPNNNYFANNFLVHN